MATRTVLCVVLTALTLIGQSITTELEALNRAAGTQAKLTPTEAKQRTALLHQLIALDPKRAIELARLETPSDTQGTLIATVEDDFARRKSQTRWSLRTKDGLIDLYFAGSTPNATATCGRTVKATGIRIGTRIAVSEIILPTGEFEDLTQAQCSATGSGTHNVAVILLRTPATPLPASVTPANITNFLFGSGQSLRTYWSEVSYGRITAAGSVFGPYTLDTNYTCDQQEQILFAALTAAGSAVDVTQYHHIALVFPNVGSCAIGVASVGCRDLFTSTNEIYSTGVSWLRADYMTRVDLAVALSAHELGHNMGLDHANTMTYPSIPLGNPASATFSEYGDYFSTMGLMFVFNGSALMGHYGAPHKFRLGWFDPPNVVQVTSSGTYTIAPIESSSTSPQALRIRRTFDADLWIEYRRNTGYNATTATVISDFNGAWIRYQSPTLAFDESYTNLLNFHPGTGVKNSLLRVGETWQDPNSTLRLRVDTATDTGLTITVTDPPSIPIPTVTSVSMSPNPPVAYQQFTLTVNGSGFDPATAQILIGSTAIANASLTVKTSTQLQASASRFAGTHNVTVRNGANGIPSNAAVITVAATASSPSITSITPNPAPSGTGTYTVNGANFNASTAIVQLNGTTITPTSRTTTQLVFTADLAAGSYSAVVRNGVGGTASNAVTLSANAPVLSTISPSVSPTGSNTFTLTGSNFNTATAQVEVGPITLTPSSRTANQIVFTTNLQPGSYAVLVRNGSAGAASNVLTLTINAPALSTITPNPATAGSNSFTLTGSNFNTATALVEVGSTVITPSSITSTQIVFTANLTAATHNVLVRNGTGGTASNTITLTVNASAGNPAISSITPNPTPSGPNNFTITGTNFNASTAQVELGTTVITPTSRSTTQLTFSANLISGTYAAIVRNGPSGTASNTFTLTLDAPDPLTMSPSPAPSGSNTFTLTGTNFNTTAAVVEVGTTVITPISIAQNQVVFSAALPAGTHNVLVRNGVGGTPSKALVLTVNAPALSSVSPNTATAGSNTFTLTGTNFNPTSAQVEIGATVIAPVSISPTQIVFTTNLTAGNYNVIVRNGSGGAASNTVALTVNPAVVNPTLTSITPNPTPSGSNTFTLTGTNFNTSTAQVELGTTVITPTSRTATQLVFSTTLPAGSYSVVARNGSGGTASNALTLTLDPPDVSLIAPNPAPTGINTFTLTGTNFNATGAVVEVDAAAVSPSSVSTNQLVFTTTLAAGNHNVLVRNGTGGTASRTLVLSVNPPALSTVSPNPATSGSNTYTLTGTGFNPASAQVEIGTTVITPTSRTTTQIVFVTTLAAGSYSALVRNGTGGAASSPVNFTVNDPAPSTPTISSLTPNLTVSGSNTFTVNGTNFDASTAQVEVGTTVITPTSRTTTQLSFSATIPAGSYSVLVRNGTGAPASNTVTLTANAPVLSAITPNPATLASTTYTLTGSNFHAASAQVEIGSTVLTPSSRTATQLVFTATLPAGTHAVLVRNGSGGSASNPVTLTVSDPVSTTPTISSLTPNPAPSGLNTFTLSGTNFNTSTAQVEVGTNIITPTSRTATQLVFATTLPAGSYTVAVRNGFGGTSSNTVTLTVNGPIQSTIAPNPATSGSNTFTVTGTSFNTVAAQVEIGASVITPTSRTATQLTFNTSLTAGSHSVLVRNGSGLPTSNALSLTVNDPAPTSPNITSLTPNPIISGSNTFTLTGTNFNASTAQVEIGTTVIAPSSRTATQLIFTTTLQPGSYSVLVRNGPGGTASNTVSLIVNAAVSTGSHFVPITPCRAVDTRPNNILARDSSRSFTFGTCSIPSNATALALNVTLVPSGQFGFLSIWPSGQPQPVVSTMNSLDGRIKANAAIVGIGTGGAVSVYVTDPAHVLLDVNGYFVPAGTAGALAFYPLAPCRVIDTRETGGIVNKQQTRRISGGCLPSNAQAYSLNITSVPPSPLGFLTLWPDGSAQPTVSTLNNLTGTVVANAAILRGGTGGAFNAFVTDASHLIADINGYFAPPGSPGALAFYTSTPCRIFDTRNANGTFGGPAMAANATRSFTVPSSPCGIPTSAQAYVTNATVLPSGVFGFLTMWQGGQSQPTVSTLNAIDGALTSNAAIIPASPSGVIQVYTSNATHMLLDVSGYFAP